MKYKIQFAVILTEEKKTVLMIENNGVYRSIQDWQQRVSSTGGTALYCSEAESIDINLSHYFL